MTIGLFAAFVYNFVKNYRKKSTMRKYGITTMANISNIFISESDRREIFTKSSALIQFKDKDNRDRKIIQISRGTFLYRYAKKRKIDNFDTKIIYLTNGDTAYVLINKLDIHFYLYNSTLFLFGFLLLGFLLVANFIG